MEIFEIHITGDKSILERGEDVGMKTITINLLKPDRSYLRTEYMTSHVARHENYSECKRAIDKAVSKLKESGVKILRVKIESPYYGHYRDQSLYLESHFEAKNDQFPISQNVRKTTFLATDRVYNHDEYDNFLEEYKDVDVELCLFDTDIEEDKDWFDLYSFDNN